MAYPLFFGGLRPVARRSHCVFGDLLLNFSLSTHADLGRYVVSMRGYCGTRSRRYERFADFLKARLVMHILAVVLGVLMPLPARR